MDAQSITQTYDPFAIAEKVDEVGLASARAVKSQSSTSATGRFRTPLLEAIKRACGGAEHRLGDRMWHRRRSYRMPTAAYDGLWSG